MVSSLSIEPVFPSGSAELTLVYNPAAIESLIHVGISLIENSRSDIGLRLIKRAVRVDRSHGTSARENLGVAFLISGRLTDAILQLSCAVATCCDRASVYVHIGIALERQNQYERAAIAYRRAINLGQLRADIFNALGVFLDSSGHSDQARVFFKKSIVLQPNYGDCLSNYADSSVGELSEDESISWGNRAHLSDPTNPVIIFNHGCLLQRLLKLHDAQLIFDRALSIAPTDADTRFNKALNSLTLGRFAEGWADYEWRWRTRVARSAGLPIINFKPPTISEIKNKTIIIFHEQGFGDSIQFSRYGRLASQSGANVILSLPGPLIRLFETQPWVTEVIKSGSSMPSCDYYCPMMSLPLMFATSIESIPFNAGAYLSAPYADAQRWCDFLSEKFLEPNIRVGLVWNGGFRPDRPDLRRANIQRNVSLEAFSRALDIEGINYIILQKGDPAEAEIRDREHLYWTRSRVYNAGSFLSDFADTAGLIANLDLVITVDTATAHLSAALGKPTWILNRYNTCWRWLLDRQDSPWYSAVRLYRQGVDRNWASTLTRVAADLRRVAARHIGSGS